MMSIDFLITTDHHVSLGIGGVSALIATGSRRSGARVGVEQGFSGQHVRDCAAHGGGRSWVWRRCRITSASPSRTMK